MNPHVGRTDTAAIEPAYLAALESERSHWWSSRNCDTWKNLYVSEYARGFDIIATIKHYVPAFDATDARVLDVGCGDAGALIAFAEAGSQCSGVETDEKSLARGRIRAREHSVQIQLQRGVAEQLPFDDGRFDLVMLDNVLEHVRDQQQTLREARRVMAPRGLLYVVTPKPFALYSLWNDPHYDLAGLVLMPRWLQIKYFEGLRGGGQGTYDVGHIPTRRQLLVLLRAAGFQLLASPRELWLRYLRNRVAHPEEIRAGPKRALARYMSTRAWIFDNPVAALIWDVAVGSNIFLARSS